MSAFGGGASAAEMGGFHSNLEYQAMDGAGGVSPRPEGRLRRSSSTEAKEAISKAAEGVSSALQAAINAMSQAGDDALPKVFPSQAFRLRWLVDLNGTWRGVESMLHVGEKGVRLTQVVLTTPGANGKIGGVEHKQIGAWQYGDVLEWGASDTHLLLACKSSKVPKGKDYILETSQAEAIVSKIKQYVVVATIRVLPEPEVKKRLTLMAQELDQMMTMKKEMLQVKRTLAELHAETNKARERNEQRQVQLEAEQQRRRELGTYLLQIEQKESTAAPPVKPGTDLLSAFGVSEADLQSPRRMSVDSDAVSLASIDRRLSICSLNSSIEPSLDGSVEPVPVPQVDEATQSMVMTQLLTAARELQAAGESNAAAALVKRVDSLAATAAASPPPVRRRSISTDSRRDSIVSMTSQASLGDGERRASIVSASSMDDSLEPLSEEGVRERRGDAPPRPETARLVWLLGIGEGRL